MHGQLFLLFVFALLSPSYGACNAESSNKGPERIWNGPCSLHKTIYRPLLITGCARSGTKYISKMISAAGGVKLPHERLGQWGMVSWLMAVDADLSPYGPPSKNIEFENTFHQVRDPRKVITSCMTLSTHSWEFIEALIPKVKESDPLLIKCAKYYYYWNLEAEKKANWRYRIEDIDEVLDVFSSKSGIQIDRTLMETIPKDLNTREHRPYMTWEELQALLPAPIYKKILRMAKKYGYLPTNREGI